MATKEPMRNRPKNLNLFTIRLPINAVVSILHRVSGMLLFLLLPALIWAMRALVSSHESFNGLVAMTQYWIVKLILVGFSWAFFHHFYAGLRHLGQDVHWMTTLKKARFSSSLILYFTGLSVATFAYCIW